MGHPLSSARDLVAAAYADPQGLQELPPGRLIELSGSRACAPMSAAVTVLLQAQADCETTAWIQPADGPLYPPDLDDCGVDLAALAVIHVPRHAGEGGAFKAADLLLRSGAFGLVVIDLRKTDSRVDRSWLGRLLALAREHQSRIVLLSTKNPTTDSLGPLVSLRLEPQRTRIGRGVFVVESNVLKNKEGLLLHGMAERRRGPWGLR